ncbi:hypothetical protein evm_013922 [Chilo suppressalis]|nr:hypothetical protein evm_013922 [Chilo suppressalis]
MELGGHKKRTINFSSDEKRILTELVLKYRDIVENKRTDATTNSVKIKGWIRLTEEFNTISTYCHRTHTVLKCCWENIKRQSKKDRAARKKSLFMTGGGKPPSPAPSNQGSSAVVDAILGPALEGVSNIYDSDACGSVIKDFVELHHPVDNTFILEDNAESEKNKENIEFSFLSMDEVRQPNNKDDGEVEKSLC